MGDVAVAVAVAVAAAADAAAAEAAAAIPIAQTWSRSGLTQVARLLCNGDFRFSIDVFNVF
jgi:uncharacterized protein (DUF2147 family)